MSKVRAALAVALFSLLAGVTAASGAMTSSVTRDFTEVRTTPTQSDYAVVVLKDPPAAAYTGGIGTLRRTKPERGQKLNPRAEEVRAYVSYLSGAQSEYRGWLGSKAKSAEVVRDYALAANALAIKLNGTRASTLSQGPGVKYVTSSWTYQPAMNISNGLIDADALWGVSGGQGNAGSGIKVGIIDSGIDDTHEFFRCKGQIQHKVYASGGNPPPFALDTLVNDHGTHVAGTVAGCVTAPNPQKSVITETLSGVAPGAALYDYNVFPGFGGGWIAFGGSAFSHDICAAIEDSVADGMDVINMSLGGGVQGPHDFLAECSDAAVDAGLVVAVAAGNSGPGDSTAESPGSAAKVITAGASTNPHFIGVPFSAVPSSGPAVSGGAAYGDFAAFGDVTADYAKATPANGCTAVSGVAGKVALINRGACTFGTKVRNAEAAGAIGVLVANNVAGDPTAMGADGLGNGTIPAAMVSKTHGSQLGAAGTVTIDGDNVSEIKTSNADIIAGFSSRGPTPFTDLIKPDITAPGVNVYSSVFGGEYAMFQGTSMATPHVAGAAALLKALNPGWSPADVKSALVTTGARTVTDHVNAAVDPGVLARGGGRIDLDAANAAVVSLNPPSTSFGLWNGNKAANATRTVTVTNLTGSAQTCPVTVSAPIAGLVTASPSSLNLGPNASATLTLTLDGGKAATLGSADYSGDVTLGCAGSTHASPWWTRVVRNGKP
ncbi:MAG: S8 family serine peptidase [Thermoleophilia bacterium]|nr:S8 family serine peptidase [Thermoleophilia bacterium]